MKMAWRFSLVCLVFVTMGVSCKTKREIRREQEYERIKQEVRDAKGARADLESISEETRTELTRQSTALEEQGQLQRNQNEELKKDLAATNARLQALEQQFVAANAAQPPKAPKVSSYDSAKALFDDQKFEEAAEESKAVVKTRPKNSAEGRKAQFLLAEAYFAMRDFGAAALGFSEYKKDNPKDPSVPVATFRQAQCFKNLGKEKEARLFYQEILERFPKSSVAAQAKKELKKTR